MDDRERELTEATAELSETLKALRSELQEPPRGPLGLPRPPSPGEILRFTEQYTIPTVIALLEASIRTLELLAAALRVADGRPLDAATGADRSSRTGSLETVGEVGRDRLAAASRETLRRLDEALAELQSAAAAGDPSNRRRRGGGFDQGRTRRRGAGRRDGHGGEKRRPQRRSERIARRRDSTRSAELPVVVPLGPTPATWDRTEGFLVCLNNSRSDERKRSGRDHRR